MRAIRAVGRLVSQPPVPPGLLSPQAERLSGGQYADRPRLPPIPDAVLAAAPALGEVTVEARAGSPGSAIPRLDDVGDHAGHVVRPADLVGQLDQPTDGLLRILGRAQGVPDSPSGDHGGQAV